MGGAWVALVVAAFVFLLLLICILQNGQRAQVSFLGAHGRLPMGVALLLAAVFGVLLVALPGTIQLRMLGRRRGTAIEPQLPRPPTTRLARSPISAPRCAARTDRPRADAACGSYPGCSAGV
jgi:uncharacterized integral membrane protein